MKYLKRIRNIIQEQQLALFNDYKSVDKPQEVVSHLVTTYKKETKEEIQNFIQTWKDALNFFLGKKNIEKYRNSFIETLDDVFAYDDLLYDNFYEWGYFSELFRLILEFLKENKIVIDNEYIDKFISTKPGYSDFSSWIDKIGLSFDIEKFFLWIIKKDLYFDIFPWLEQEYNFMIEWISNGERKLYRMITLPEKIEDLVKNNDYNYTGVGEYWTYNKDSAEAYWGGNSDTSIVLEVEVEANDVNWEKTLTASVYRLNIEKEVNVHKGATLKLNKIYIDNKLYNSLLDKDDSYYRDILKLDYLTINQIKHKKKEYAMQLDYSKSDKDFYIII